MGCCCCCCRWTCRKKTGLKHVLRGHVYKYIIKYYIIKCVQQRKTRQLSVRPVRRRRARARHRDRVIYTYVLSLFFCFFLSRNSMARPRDRAMQSTTAHLLFVLRALYTLAGKSIGCGSNLNNTRRFHFKTKNKNIRRFLIIRTINQYASFNT